MKSLISRLNCLLGGGGTIRSLFLLDVYVYFHQMDILHALKKLIACTKTHKLNAKSASEIRRANEP
jgi:hypothetical protein